MAEHVLQSIYLRDVVARLEENRIDYEILSLEGNAQIVVTQYGGRVLGPFSEDGSSFSWLSSVFRDSRAFRDFIDARAWNLGGDRFWVAPEHPLFVKDRSAFNETYAAPAALDPGNYRLSRQGDGVRLEQTVHTALYQSVLDAVDFGIDWQITPARNPLVWLPENARPNVRFCGYEHAFTLEGLSGMDELNLEPWNLLQTHPGGKIIIPFTGAFSFVDYYEPVADNLIVHDRFVELTADGHTRYKTAFYALNTLGRAVYINRNEQGGYLIYKQYYNDVSNPYCCDPADRPGQSGCSLYVYNDNGSNGAYAEFENSGLTIGKGTERVRTTTSVSHLFFAGDKPELEKLLWTLLGVRYDIQI